MNNNSVYFIFLDFKMWLTCFCFFASSSARATHGFNSGKIAFSVKWAGNMEVKLDEVKEPHEIRVGFSTNDCNLQAGESPLSFCCINTGKKASNSEFEDFECKFTNDDVITALLDMQGNQVQISYMKNGDTLGEFC